MHFSIPETQEFANGSSGVFTVSTSVQFLDRVAVLHNQAITHTHRDRTKILRNRLEYYKGSQFIELNKVLELNKSFTRRYCKQVQGGKKKSENSHKPRRAAAEASFDTRFFQGQTSRGITTRKLASLMKCLHAKPLPYELVCLRCAILFRNFVVVDKTGTFWIITKLS